MSKTCLPYDPDRQLLLPAALREWLPEDHLACFISDVVDRLDFAEIDVWAATGLPVTITDGASAACTRQQLGITKSHVNDATCLDLPTEVVNHVAKATVLKRQGRQCRQAINCDASGYTASKDFPAYSRLPRCGQGYTTPPGHSTEPRRLHGIAIGDIVLIHHHTGRTYTGRATLKFKDRRVIIKGKPAVSTKASEAVVVAHRQRWTVTPKNPAHPQYEPHKTGN